MAINVAVNVYQINQRFLPRDMSQRIGFPTAGIMVMDTINSPTRSLPSGYNVYGAIKVIATGELYYTQETAAQLITAINA